MKFKIFSCVLGTVVTAMIPANGQTAVSVEQHYVFKMDITRDIPTMTFVIGDSNKTRELRPPAAISTVENNKMHLTIRKKGNVFTGEKQVKQTQSLIQPVHFDFSSSALSEEAEEKLLTAITKKISKSTLLVVTGYTCDLGTQKANDFLARKRAETVADMLKALGFKVVAVMGKGKQGYITDNPDMRHLNRRVEIAILSQSTNMLQ